MSRPFQFRPIYKCSRDARSSSRGRRVSPVGARRFALLCALLAVSSLTVSSLVGCGGDAGTGGSAGGAGGGAGGGAKQYAAASLPKVVQELPPLDGGRIELPTPDGWSYASQSKGLITRFHLKGRTGIPQIIVKVEESAGGIASVTGQNIVEYANQVQAELDSLVQQKKLTLLEPARPLLLGDQPWARYVVTGKLPGKDLATIERQILRTTQAGRTYTIDLQVKSNDLGNHRDHAYAIAAGVKFHAGGAPAAPAEAVAPAEPAASAEAK